MATPARAALIRVDFAGSIDLIAPNGDSLLERVGSSIQLGTPFAGFFVFDDQTEPYTASVLPSETNFQYHLREYYGAAHHVAIGDYEMGIGQVDHYDWPVAFQAFVHYSPYTNGYLRLLNSDPLSVSGPASDALTLLRIDLQGEWGTIPESAALEDLSWDLDDYLSQWSTATFGFRDEGEAVDFRGRIHTLTARPVFEPGALGPLVFFSVALGLSRIRARGSARIVRK